MKEELQTLLVENMGETRDDYSGRGMFGEKTLAVVFDSQKDFTEAVSWAAFYLGQDGNDNAEDLMKDLTRVRTDQMGKDGIVVY